jgi:hypothetical protein
VDFGNLWSEELGGVYESLLELIPRYEPQERSYALTEIAGNERKEIGSYYTPPALVECLLDAALDPLLDHACLAPSVEQRTATLLDITVCDPACGSGGFLVAAARRIARRLAAEESGEPEPPDAVVRGALRRVVGPCIHGVDIDPMAAELTRLSLWMAAIEPGKPLNFLEPNIRVGNSLLGVTPKLLRNGIPNEAFEVLPGDDRRVAARLLNDNVLARAGYQQLPAPIGHSMLSRKTEEIARFVPDTLAEQYVRQRTEYIKLRKSPEWRSEHTLANGWCAAFVQEKSLEERPVAVDHDTLRKLIEEPESIQAEHIQAKITKLTAEYQFFHWHLEFPRIFRIGDDATNPDPATDWAGGFSCVIGNPPWDRVKRQEQEFFAQRDVKIATAPNAAARKQLIAALAVSDDPARRELYADFARTQRRSAGWSLLLRRSGRYPLTGRGDINTYAVFAETFRTVVAPAGRFGVIVPTGIATDATTAPFLRDLVENQRLDSLLGFVTNPRIWTDVGHRRYPFSILVVTGRQATVPYTEFATLARHPDELPPRGRRIRVPPEDLLLVNPNTGTCPMFRSQRDAEITVGIYRRVPVLWREHPEENPWGLSFLRMFDMANDSRLFRTREQLLEDDWTPHGNVFTRDGRRMLPLYEAKLIHHFDHRLACYSKRPEGSQDTELPRLDLDEKSDPQRVVQPRYWVPEFSARNEERSTPDRDIYDAGVQVRVAARGWHREWFFGWRDICRSTDERTMICSLLPRAAVGHKLPLALPSKEAVLLLATNWSSFVLDYVARQKISGTSMTYFVVKQLPVLPPQLYDQKVPWGGGALSSWIMARVLELSYTAYDMESFARDLGDEGAPFRWDEGRRAQLRAELDAAYFHLYGIGRDDVDYIMETFPIVKRHDEERLGEYRTKRMILEVYDAMADAVRDGTYYQTLLHPPPGHGPRHTASVAR